MSKILITNNGPHPPEKWAMTTAQTIFDIGSTVVGNRLIEAQKIQIAIAEALLFHHTDVQVNEKARLASDVSYINTLHSAEEYIEKAISDIISAVKGSSWESHFMNVDVLRAIKEIIVNHFMTSQHIERLWHADSNPQCAISQEYKTKFVG